MGTPGSESSPGRRPGLARKLAVALVTVLLSLLGWEALLRYRVFGLAGFSPELMASMRPFGNSGMLRVSDTPGLIYELKPGLDTTFKLQEFRTNSHGMRDREYALDKSEGTLRIAVLGDSFTMGSGVALEATYHAVLEERLARRFGGTVEVLSFGVAGYDPQEYAAVLEGKALRFDPDLILVGLMWNDSLLPPEGFTREKFRVPRTIEIPFLRPRLLTLWKGLGRRQAHEPLTFGDRMRAHVQESFERIAGAAGKRPVVCIYLSTSASADELACARWFEPLAREAGFEFLDTTALFDGPSDRTQRVLPHDGHPNVATHARYADVLEGPLAGWIAERLGPGD